MSERRGIAGQYVIEPSGIPIVFDDPGPEIVYLPKGATIHPTWPFTTEQDLRAFIRVEVHAALDGLAKEIRQSKEFQPVQVPAGVCWACGESGKAEEMMWLDQFGKRSHLIHATVECIRAAEAKPETREHRG